MDGPQVRNKEMGKEIDIQTQRGFVRLTLSQLFLALYCLYHGHKAGPRRAIYVQKIFWQAIYFGSSSQKVFSKATTDCKPSLWRVGNPQHTFIYPCTKPMIFSKSKKRGKQCMETRV